MLTQKITDNDILNGDYKLKLMFLGKEREMERLNEKNKSKINRYIAEYNKIYKGLPDYNDKKSDEIVKQAEAFIKSIFPTITKTELEHLSGVDFENLNKDVIYWDERARGLSDEDIQRFRKAQLEGLIRTAEEDAKNPDFQE